MIFPPDYELGMTLPRIAIKWPNLKENKNFIFKSIRTWDYNCIAWALGKEDDWIQFEYTIDGELRLDISLKKYIDYFLEQGFEICDNSLVELNIDKICIYADENNVFTHVCLQMENGKWKSKMGNYEDIYHDDLESLLGSFYGSPKVYMKRRR